MLQAPISKSEEDKIFMKRCLQLAAHAVDTAPPNPMVGAVVVHQGKIIGEGWHRKAGQAHAEPNAIRSVKNQELLKESTLYVSLEPCSHYGKTPPCSDLIIEKHIPKVVIGCEDPFPRVSGRGIRKLKEAGIEVIVGVERDACLQLNRQFITFHRQHRPYITLKWAQSADGKIDHNRKSAEEKPLQISTPFTGMMVHKLRHESDAIMVGSRTVLLDNPSLSIRNWPSDRNPIRIALDRKGNIPLGSHLLDGSQPAIIFTKQETRISGNTEWLPYQSLEDIMEELYRRGIQRLLVEGGQMLHQSLIDKDLWDEIQFETSNIIMGNGLDAPRIPNLDSQTNPDVYRRSRFLDGHKIQHVIKKIRFDSQ